MKRLYRDKSNEMIAGVCSGIANYLDVDPTVVRLLFVVFLFLGGGGLWIYLVLWFIMPEEPAASDKTVDAVEKKTAPKKIAASKASTTKPATSKAPAKKTSTAKPTAKTATEKKPPAKSADKAE